MNNASFEGNKSGYYEKALVDDYIKRLTEAYQIAYNEYQTVNEKLINLMEEYKKLESTLGTDDKSDAIAKALINAEITAGNTIKKAEEEAQVYLDRAHKKIDDANQAFISALDDAIATLRIGKQ